MSKSLSELADEYLAEAQRLKNKIVELEAVAGDNLAAVNHTIAVYSDMYMEVMSTYNTLKEYYKKQ